MEVIAVIAQKGGTGKTATVAAMAQAATHFSNKKVLLIDLDAQGNLSLIAGADTSKGSTLELLEGAEPAELIQHINDNMDIIAASWNLATVTTAPGSINRLKKALEPIKNSYDLVIIDTPPLASELQFNALMAADSAIIPIEADIYGLQCLFQLADTIEAIKEANKKLIVKGYLFTRYDSRSILTRTISQNIHEEAEKLGFSFIGSVRPGIALKEAQATGQNLFEYAPRSNPAKDYRAIYELIIDKK